MKNKYTPFVFTGIGIVLVAIFMMSAPTKSSQLQGEDFLNTYKNTSNAVLLDVRTSGEFNEGHMSGAINIDYNNQSFESEVKKLDTTKTYFVYCRSGNRSGKAISMMQANGFANIYELKGGVVSNPELIK